MNYTSTFTASALSFVAVISGGGVAINRSLGLASEKVLIVTKTVPIARSVFMPGTLLFLAAISVSGQSSTPTKSAKEVVQEFWKIEIQGGRLTPNGWYKTSGFFIRPVPFAPKMTIHVILPADSYAVDEVAKTDNWAEVYVGTTGVGTIDSALRFESAVKAGSRELVVGPIVKFNLVLTDRHWGIKPDGVMGEELPGPPTWRIDCTDNSRWITVDIAIRYVTEMRNKTSDPTTKRNANATLVILTTAKSTMPAARGPIF